MTEQKFSQKYSIVQLFEDRAEGYEFHYSSWPLHSTVVDTFAIDWSADRMAEELTKALQACIPARSVGVGDEYFGPNKEVHVMLLEKTPELLNLHSTIINTLENGGLILNDSQYAKDGFLPHATIQKHAQIRHGQAVEFTELSIIDMLPDQDPYNRKILKTIKIGS